MIYLKNISYIKIVNDWLEFKKNNIKYSTYIKYKYYIDKYIYDYFNKYNFKKLNSNDINNFFLKDNINKLSDSTKKLLFVIIKSSIKYGTNKGYRKTNIDINISFKIKKEDISYLTINEQDKLENYIKNNINIRNIMILTALYTGVRIGELCTIKCSDIDIINNTISINKTVQRIKEENNNKTILLIDKPKTENSIRIVPVPKFIIDYLKKYITKKDTYIFTGSNSPKDPRSVEKYFSNLLRKLNIRHLNFHSLRHTYATRLKENKIDIKVISELLGHSDWKITEGIYVHATFEHKRRSIKELEINWTRKSS